MTVRIHQGDCRDVLASLPPDSVHMVCTSPPYWGLRDYGNPPSVWGGDPDCAHDFARETVDTEVGKGNWAQGVNGRGEAQPGGVKTKREPIRAMAQRGFCRHCGAWRGAFGLEPTYQLYVAHAVEVFRAVRRVLRPDGVMWLNIGDSYATGGGAGWQGKNGQRADRRFTAPEIKPAATEIGLKPKDLVGMPWRLAFALQQDGWWLRQDLIWSKPNPMPESVTDRCTKAHEYLFLLSKSARYFFDADAIKEQVAEENYRPTKRKGVVRKSAADDSLVKGKTSFHATTAEVLPDRNKRSVWTVATSPFPEAHFATFPPELVEPCIKAGTSERGCCAKCGAPWERKVEKSGGTTGKSWHGHGDDLGRGLSQTVNPGGGIGNARGDDGRPYTMKTLGWSPSCTCHAAIVPCTVLDPFGGAGTTGLVADRLQRDAILIDRNPDYVAMAQRRIAADAPLLTQSLAAE